MTATGPTPKPRYIFSGHAIGASAQFDGLDGVTNLNHVVPTQAASVLPQTGGLSQSSAPSYKYTVDKPRPRTLFSIGQASSTGAGRSLDGRFETEVEVDVQSVEVVEKLRIGLLRLHMLSTFALGGKEPVVTTTGNRLEEVWLGNVQAKIELDDEPLTYCGTQDQLAGFYRDRDTSYRQKYAWRFATGPGAPEIAPQRALYPPQGALHKCSIVRAIELVGAEVDKQPMSVKGYTITWAGFGKIILGEVHVTGNARQLTMVRLEMGSDASGSGSAGDGRSNGAVSP